MIRCCGRIVSSHVSGRHQRTIAIVTTTGRCIRGRTTIATRVQQIIGARRCRGLLGLLSSFELFLAIDGGYLVLQLGVLLTTQSHLLFDEANFGLARERTTVEVIRILGRRRRRRGCRVDDRRGRGRRGHHGRRRSRRQRRGRLVLERVERGASVLEPTTARLQTPVLLSRRWCRIGVRRLLCAYYRY